MQRQMRHLYRPVRRVHIKRRIRFITDQHLRAVRVLDVPSTVRLAHRRVAPSAVVIIQRAATPVATTVLVSHSVPARHIAAVVCRTVAQHKHRVGHVMGVLGGLLILSAIKHVRQHRSVHTAVLVN